MRLAIVRQRYNPFGGAERFIERAVAALAESGTAVTVIARSWKQVAAPGTVQHAMVCDPFHVGRRWRDSSFARAVCRLLDRESFDLVQSHERIACCDIFRAGDGVHRQWLTLRAREQSLVGRLATRFNAYHRYLLAAEARLFSSPRLRAVICNSAMVRADVLRHFSIDPSRLHVIHNGIDLDMFHPGLRAVHRKTVRECLGIASSAHVYLMVGSGFARKGVFRLLPAFAMAAPPGSHLVVVGADRALDKARALARRLGCADRVHFTGGVDDVRPFYGAADTFVLPTLYDPFPNAAIEAMACGLPVITTLQSGAAEFIEHGINGQVCDALDRDALERCLVAAAAFPPAASGAARAAVAGLSIGAMAERLLALYEQLLEPAPAAGTHEAASRD
jgi:UDP-glucose:(heptosyl)LPS alpha-1,3-glucosyltransferase